MKSSETIEAKLKSISPILVALQTMAESKGVVLEAIYQSTLATANIGPISNEVLQQVLTQGKYIDIMTDPANERYWQQANSAHSYGGLGHHTSVIYFENMATPVLKTGTFDPSAFITAHGKLYQKAWDTAVGLFGIPAAASTTTEAGKTATVTPNVFDLRKRHTASQRKTREIQTNLVTGLREILNASGTDDAKKAAETAKAAAGRLTSTAAQ